MTVEAPFSKFKKTNFKIYIAFCFIAGVVLAYDGYITQFEWAPRHSFYVEHVVENDGVPDATMNFNRYVPILLAVGIAWWGYKLYKSKDIRVIADEEKLITPDKEITYNSMVSVDKTHFEGEKGYFVINYEPDQGQQQKLKLSANNYDNLSAVLDRIVEKIS